MHRFVVAIIDHLEMENRTASFIRNVYHTYKTLSLTGLVCSGKSIARYIRLCTSPEADGGFLLALCMIYISHVL